MLITLEEWAEKTFSKPPHINTLRAWAKTGQINPVPVKVARRYCVEEDARYVPLVEQPAPCDDPLIRRILDDGSKAA